jgi:hypothetical protein
MSKARMRRGGAGGLLRRLGPLVTGGTLVLLCAVQTPAFAAVVPTPNPGVLPTGLPTPPPVSLPPTPPVTVPTSAPVPVPTPVGNPLPPPPPAPVPTPAVAVPTSVPNPGLPNPAGAAGVPAGAGFPAGAALPAGAAGALPSGVSSASSPVDPSSGSSSAAAAAFAPGPLSLGERDFSSSGSAGASAGSSGAAVAGSNPTGQASPVSASSQPVSTICPQLTFAPLVTGCQSVLGPLNGPLSGPVGQNLAHTGTPIALGLAGLLLIGLGAVLYRRSGRYQASAASGRYGRFEAR